MKNENTVLCAMLSIEYSKRHIISIPMCTNLREVALSLSYGWCQSLLNMLHVLVDYKHSITPTPGSMRLLVRRDDDDDYDEPSPRFPSVVMTAGIIWILIGSLSLLGAMSSILIILSMPQQRVGAGSDVLTWGVVCSGAVGLAFAICGFQTVQGKSSDTIGNGIGSLILGILALFCAIAMAFGGLAQFGNQNAKQPVAGQQAAAGAAGLMVTAMIVGLWALTLILAGTLALVGRSDYLEWREANAPRPRRHRRRRRRYEDEEDDDDQ